MNATDVTSVVAKSIARERAALQITQDQLAQRCAKCGLPWTRSVIASLERGARRLNVDELIVVAIALDVAVLRLFATEVEEVRLGNLMFRAPDLPRLLTSRPRPIPTDFTEMTADIANMERMALRATEQKAGARLGIEPRSVAALALELFGHGLEEEREARAPAGANKQQRAAITARLIERDLKPAAIKFGYLDEETQQ